MCGIYGILNFDRSEQPCDSILAAMGGVITHRGPDDFGQYRCRGVGLGMTTAYSMPAASSLANNSTSAAWRSAAGALVFRYTSKSMVGVGMWPA